MPSSSISSPRTASTSSSRAPKVPHPKSCPTTWNGCLVSESSPLPLQYDHQLDMRREQEMVDRHDAGNVVAAIDEDAQMMGASAGIARDHDDLRHLRSGQRLGLRLGACPRRIEHHG